MAALTASPTSLSTSIRVMGAGFTPSTIRHAGQQGETTSVSLAVSGGFSGAAGLSSVGGATWIGLPGPESVDPTEVFDGVPVEIAINATDLPTGHYNDVVRALKDGFNSIDIPISLAVLPGGGKAA